jgi:hypothetical protein
VNADDLAVASLVVTILLGLSAIVVAVGFDRRTRASQRRLDASVDELGALVSSVAEDTQFLVNLSEAKFDRASDPQDEAAGAAAEPALEAAVLVRQALAETGAPVAADQLVEQLGGDRRAMRTTVTGLYELRALAEVTFSDPVIGPQTIIDLVAER